MRPMLRAFPLVAFLLVLLAHEARPKTENITVTAVDDRITYYGGWTVQENGIRVFTSVPGSFALNFTGSAIYWYSRRLYDGALAEITLDNDAVSLDLSNGMGQNDTPVVEVLYEKEGLDGSENHYFNVTWAGIGLNDGGTFLENYRIIYTTSDGSSSSSSSSPSSSSTSSAGVTSAKSNAGAIAGGVVGGVVGILLVVAVVLLCLRRRRTRAVARMDMQSATPFSLVESPAPGAPSGTISSMPSMKPGLDHRTYITSQSGDRTLYPSSSATPPSPGRTAPVVSSPENTSRTSRFSLLRGWNRSHSEPPSRKEGSADRTAPRPSVVTGTFAEGVQQDMSEHTATTPTVSPRSPGATSYSDVLHDPPPLYTN